MPGITTRIPLIGVNTEELEGENLWKKLPPHVRNLWGTIKDESFILRSEAKGEESIAQLVRLNYHFTTHYILLIVITA